MKTIAFFSNREGVGQTTLVYHLAHMFAERGLSVVAVDLDPQANLSSMWLTDDRIEELWHSTEHPTISQALQPLLAGAGDVSEPHLEAIRDGLSLVVGDLSLSQAEDQLGNQWAGCLNGDRHAFRVVSAVWRMIEAAARKASADLVLIDVGPNLAALNRAALIAANSVVIPLAPDPYSVQALRTLGPALRQWRGDWRKRLDNSPAGGLSLPPGDIMPLGYVVMLHGLRPARPYLFYQRWLARLPQAYEQSVLDQSELTPGLKTEHDPHCLAMLRHNRSLMPLALEALKPMFSLKPAEGAVGAHVAAVRDCYADFLQLARRITSAIGIELNGTPA